MSKTMRASVLCTVARGHRVGSCSVRGDAARGEPAVARARDCAELAHDEPPTRVVDRGARVLELRTLRDPDPLGRARRARRVTPSHEVMHDEPDDAA